MYFCFSENAWLDKNMMDYWSTVITYMIAVYCENRAHKEIRRLNIHVIRWI